jgi:hypothetical protein
MEPEGALSHSQQSTACPYPEPDQSSPCPPPPLFHFLKIHFNFILSSTTRTFKTLKLSVKEKQECPAPCATLQADQL